MAVIINYNTAMKKILLLFLVITGLVASAQSQGKDGFSFYSAASTKEGSQDFKDEFGIFNLSLPDKIFVHNDMTDQENPVAQVYRVKSYEVVMTSKYDWYADFTVTAKDGATFKGKLTVIGDSDILLIGGTVFIGTKSIIKPYEKSGRK